MTLFLITALNEASLVAVLPGVAGSTGETIVRHWRDSGEITVRNTVSLLFWSSISKKGQHFSGSNNLIPDVVLVKDVEPLRGRRGFS